MKSNQTLAILFWHRKSKADTSGYAPIICRMTIDGIEEEFSTAKKVHVNGWDIENKKAVSGSNFKTVNSELNTIKVSLESYFLVLRTQFEVVTPMMLKNVYKNIAPELDKDARKSEEAKVPTLIELSAHHILEFEELVRLKKRSAETLKQWRATQNKLKEFLLFEYKKEDVAFSSIEYSFAPKFHRYLTVTRVEKLGEAAAMKQIKNTKQILNIAVSNNYIQKNPIENFKCGAEEPVIPPLEIEEVEKMWRKGIKIERLEKVRDAFIFQCFTGFAYQDIYNLTPEHIIKVGIHGERWLVKERGKTGVTESVPILPIIEELIEKYKNDPYCIANNCLIPVNSNYRYNCYLKELADVCGLKRDLNTHLARHTFADIMLNVLDFPLEDVSKMLGHKSIRTTQRYARVKKRRIGNRMRDAKGLIFDEDGNLKKLSAAS